MRRTDGVKLDGGVLFIECQCDLPTPVSAVSAGAVHGSVWECGTCSKRYVFRRGQDRGGAASWAWVPVEVKR